MKQICTITGQEFEVTDFELEHHKKVSPVFNGTRYDIQAPTLCPQERFRRRLAHHNERNLYKRKCSKTGKDIVSIYSPNKDIVVYENAEWWSDSWDALSYGKDVDFTRSFFEQFAELRKLVPRMAVTQDTVENSTYTSCVSNLKNCYLLFTSDFSQDCAYGVWNQNSRDCYDNFMIDRCELCYECMFADGCYNCIYTVFSSNCSDSKFLFDCHGCTDCFMSHGLRNKKYYIRNTEYSKEEYMEKMAAFSIASSANQKLSVNMFKTMVQKEALHLYMWRKGRVSNSSGDLLQDAENCIECYEAMRAKDCMYSLGYEMKDALDCTYANAELGYENCECFPMAHQSAFNVNSYTGSNLYYCDLCMNSCSNCFGCIGLKHKEYCILNKQYTKGEYEVFVPKLIEHMRALNEWGEFMPKSLSNFAYNESLAQDYFPLTKEQCITKGNKWLDRDEREYQPATCVIPDSIADTDESLADNILACETCSKNYKVIKQELEFYKKIGIAVPRNCFECRYAQRRKMKNPRKLCTRNCDDCSKGMETVYSPERSEKVVCEHCYEMIAY